MSRHGRYKHRHPELSRPVQRVPDREMPEWISQAESFAADNAYLGDRRGVPHVNGQPYFGAAVFDLRDCRQDRSRLLEALRDMKRTHGMHGPCEGNDCPSCRRAYDRARALLKELEADARLAIEASREPQKETTTP